MSDAAYYRAEAQRMLDWAGASSNAEMARRWRQLAEDYTILADRMEARIAGRAPFLRTAVQRQPAQQQQSKLGTDEHGED